MFERISSLWTIVSHFIQIFQALVRLNNDMGSGFLLVVLAACEKHASVTLGVREQMGEEMSN